MNLFPLELLEDLQTLWLRWLWELKLEAQQVFEPLGVSPIQALALALIAEGTHQPGVLAEALEVSPPMISQTLALFEERGWINREPDPTDRRRWRISLSPSGQAVRQQMKEVWLHSAKRRYAHLSEEELRMLVQLFHKLLSSPGAP